MAKRAEFLYRRGRENLKKNWLKALHYFLKTKDIAPEFLPSYYEIAEIYYRRGFIDDAIKIVNEALEINPNDLQGNFALANLLFAKNQPKEALKVYLKINEELRDTSAELCFNMAMAYHAIGNSKKAIDSLEKAIELDPYFLDAYDMAGRIYFERGDMGSSEDAFKIILELEPDHLNAHHMLGIIYSKQLLWESAIKEWEQVINLAPDTDETLRELGWALNMIGQTDRSITTLRKAIEINPKNTQARIDLSAVLITSMHFKEAIEELQEAKRDDPNNPLVDKLLKDAARFINKRG